jgi:purine-binding chemotaxis protein CheW
MEDSEKRKMTEAAIDPVRKQAPSFTPIKDKSLTFGGGSSPDQFSNGVDWTPSGEEKEKILKERARKLAAPVKTEESKEENLEVVEFLLSQEKYGFESQYIREVYPLENFTPIPCTPAFVLGVINIRGQILSIIDMGRFFDLPRKGITDLNKVIILRSDDMEFGILADEISGVRMIPVSEIQQSLPTLTGIRAEYLKGVTNDRVTLLDAKKILTDKNLIVYQEVTG